jgi:hypothetical protein
MPRDRCGPKGAERESSSGECLDWKRQNRKWLFFQDADAFGGLLIVWRGIGWPGFRGDGPELGHGHDEFYGDLGLAHEGGADEGDPAEDFFFAGHIFEADDLLQVHGSGKQDQRAVLVDDDRVGLLGDGALGVVLEADAEGHAGADALAAATVLREEVGRYRDAHDCYASKLRRDSQIFAPQVCPRRHGVGRLDVSQGSRERAAREVGGRGAFVFGAAEAAP